MKKVFLIIILCVLGNKNAFAQIVQGTKWLSGSIGFSTSNNENNSSYNFYNTQKNSGHSLSLSPTFGYFFRENQLIGAGFLFSNNKFTSEGSSSSTDKNTSSSESNLFRRK